MRLSASKNFGRFFHTDESPLFLIATDSVVNTLEDIMNKNKITLEAANDNRGGSKSAEIALASLITVLAKAYVAQIQPKEKSA